jgi:SAM-dependent methyltransferase
MSTIFTWDAADIAALLGTCDTDPVTERLRRHVPAGARVLESGCGLARFVRYLSDRGTPTVGLEWSGETLRQAHAVWPDLPLVQGDSARAPFPDASFDALLSLGLVEHWSEGPAAPLRDHLRVLKPGGVAIITVPLHNLVRRIKRALWFDEIVHLPRAAARRLLRGRSMSPGRARPGRFAAYPVYGEFHEYRMTGTEFLAEVRGAGFEVLEHAAIGSMDGIYHELNPLGLLVRFRGWRFEPTPLARWLESRLARRPFDHCHQQLVLARRP